ncbi:hypothetical protein TNCV_1648881 [Trichonephila clavipes]|uniref:Uncharacterized protein n=1 Tax=Trichonephila clavipes TaxID=2585209 RepID=A0A8X6V2I7_TRICX|nr:hypothetical protein TNCV_1648881 [Trichonephila clavipes]
MAPKRSKNIGKFDLIIKELKAFENICTEVIRNLKTLDLETNSLTELIIINFLISKVDACISQRWELSLENNKIPTLEEIRVFIEREARGLNELKFVKPDIRKATRGLWATDHVILNHGQVTWTTPELAPPSPNYHTTPTGGRFSSQQI